MNIWHRSAAHASIKGIYMTSPKIKPTRIIIADGDPLVCRALARLFPNGSGVEVVATSSDSSEVLELVSRLNPSVVLVDAHTARLNGIEVTRTLSHLFPATRIIILGVYETLHEEALSAGACRFLLKDSGRDTLIEAIRLAVSGQCEPEVC